MSELKRTQLFDAHVAAGATLVDFGGWEMPIQYPSGIVAKHLYCRSNCGIFDVSHMDRLAAAAEEGKATGVKGLPAKLGMDMAAELIAQIKDQNICPGVHIMAIGAERNVPVILEKAGIAL